MTRAWTGSTVLPAVVAVVSAAASGLAFDGAVPVRTLLPLCAVAALVPGAVAALGRCAARRRGVTFAVTAAASVLAWAALLPLAARALAAPGTGPRGWAAMVAGLPGGPRQLLVSSLPAPVTPGLLLLIGTLVWWAAAGATEAAVRGAGPLTTLCGPAVVLAAGTAATVPAASPGSVPAAALLLGAGVVLLAARSAGPRLPAAAMGVALAAVAAYAVPAAPGLGARPAADPRRLVHPAASPSALGDAFGQVAAWVSAPPRTLFTVRDAGDAAGGRVNTRWLVLDRYDGTGWTSSALYRPSGSTLPADAGADTATDAGPSVTVTQRIQVSGLPGPWLPAAATPRHVAGAEVSTASLGVLATDDGSAARGRTYTVMSRIPRPTVAGLAKAVPGSGADLAADLDVPAGLPPKLAAIGTSAMAGASYPYQQLILLQNRLRGLLAYDTRAFPGQGYGALALAVTTTHRGSQDVFATLFALLARSAGFPARLAVGFGPGHAVGDGRYEVRTTDALVWPEVYLSGLGWWPFYPVPSAAGRVSASSVGESAQQQSLDEQVAAAGQPGGARRQAPGAHARPQAARPAAHRAWGRDAAEALGALALAAVAVLAVRALVPRVRRMTRRRRRRRDPDPSRRTVGAWHDVMESVERRTGEPVEACTAAEIAARAAAGTAAERRDRVVALGVLAERVVFAEGNWGPLATVTDAAEAWRVADEVRRRFRR
ncbi:transglutaminase domain-containing protein [Streptomyces sp. NPDC051987]|uniref:transglutaminase family protein n=1 Tax=Streptomyces sp. NPDC051987 TaxID=3155808 RepID=UPI00341C32FC